LNDSHYIPSKVLKLNVGFLLNEGPGYSRENEFEIPSALRVADDLTVDYLRGKIVMSRTSRGILVQGRLHTQLQNECTRCLDEVTLRLDVPIEELYVYPPEPDAAFVVDDSGMMNLAPLVREETLLALPKHILCRPDCAGLCPTCGTNRNEGSCDCEQDTIDPRFAVLRALRDQTNTPPSSKRS
jgi:uncharacterized protein